MGTCSADVVQPELWVGVLNKYPVGTCRRAWPAPSMQEPVRLRFLVGQWERSSSLVKRKESSITEVSVRDRHCAVPHGPCSRLLLSILGVILGLVSRRVCLRCSRIRTPVNCHVTLSIRKMFPALVPSFEKRMPLRGDSLVC